MPFKLRKDTDKGMSYKYESTDCSQVSVREVIETSIEKFKDFCLKKEPV